MTVSRISEPKCFRQTCGIPNWDQTIVAELAALELNNTQSITSPPAGQHVIGCKWVYKLKLKADGSVEKYKARLVAKGYNQQEGVDFFDTFAPMAKLVTMNCYQLQHLLMVGLYINLM